MDPDTHHQGLIADAHGACEAQGPLNLQSWLVLLWIENTALLLKCDVPSQGGVILTVIIIFMAVHVPVQPNLLLSARWCTP